MNYCMNAKKKRKMGDRMMKSNKYEQYTMNYTEKHYINMWILKIKEDNNKNPSNQNPRYAL